MVVVVGWLVGCLVYCSILLHGLPTQQVSRQQGVDGSGAPDPPVVLSARGSPQAGVLGHVAPQQVASAGLASAAPLAHGVGLSASAHPVLIGSRVGLPAGGVSPQRLALCKEAVHLLLPGKLRQDGGVPKHTPYRG